MGSDREYEVVRTAPHTWEVQTRQWLEPGDPAHDRWEPVAFFDREAAARYYISDVLYRHEQLLTLP